MFNFLETIKTANSNAEATEAVGKVRGAAACLLRYVCWNLAAVCVLASRALPISPISGSWSLKQRFRGFRAYGRALWARIVVVGCIEPLARWCRAWHTLAFFTLALFEYLRAGGQRTSVTNHASFLSVCRRHLSPCSWALTARITASTTTP